LDWFHHCWSIIIGQFVLVFIFGNWLGLWGLLIIGWILLAIGIILAMAPYFIFRKKGMIKEGDKWVQTTVLIDTGLYGIVRHPLYLGWGLMVIALMLLSQHWLSLIFGIPGLILVYNEMRREDHSNIKKFGVEYENYMKRVPRLNFVVGTLRLFWKNK
jgi:protein-S-isoprenylcysteine O-methyltransferase Ste14